MESKSTNIKAMLLHLGGLCQYIFPFGNFVVPMVLWSMVKDDSAYLDNHGRRVLNFQISILVYTVILAAFAIPVLLFGVLKHIPINSYWDGSFHMVSDISPENITGINIIAFLCVLLIIVMYAVSFFLSLIAALKAVDAKVYQYPATIVFLKYLPEEPLAQTVEISPPDSPY
ncbi:DUF4870 domain-containing protein [Flavobacterium silvaticum]|uniref:DUF4870 domain-containing protein n=1 Tax=Flavobacterium silvaticum TaxID=1852020 RepID=A0A972G2M3_9FLAO|nr:DUF4870 domain-containing protein [Flavobacterium silvaticum]NMH29331.1 DUF4870 domain-containing protein [Flavobacterium silvaticum]